MSRHLVLAIILGVALASAAAAVLDRGPRPVAPVDPVSVAPTAAAVIAPTVATASPCPCG